MDNKSVQKIAVDTIEYIKKNIYVGQTLKEIRKICEEKMLSLGATSFWYYNIGAFIFAGKDTVVSVSGRKYATADYQLKADDIITIDLSPQYRKIWGDYARTIIIENGEVVYDLNKISNSEWKDGLLFEDYLYNEFKKFVTDDITFEDVFLYLNDIIKANGYINLDFNGNLGHSIEMHKNKRKYIEKGNKKLLSKVKYFTFEPHIALKDGSYGFKKENIYYFDNGVIKEL